VSCVGLNLWHLQHESIWMLVANQQDTTPTQTVPNKCSDLTWMILQGTNSITQTDTQQSRNNSRTGCTISHTSGTLLLALSATCPSAEASDVSCQHAAMSTLL
jgi:hypothetical protein